MKTKIQKQKEIELTKKRLNESKTVIFVNFQGIKTNELNKLREIIKEIGGIVAVVKKRLLSLVFKEQKIELDINKLENQICAIFSPLDTITTTKKIFNFSKPYRQKKLLPMILGVDIEANKILEKNELEMFAQLPSKEELLAKLIFLISSPIRKFAFVLNEKSKKI